MRASQDRNGEDEGAADPHAIMVGVMISRNKLINGNKAMVCG